MRTSGFGGGSPNDATTLSDNDLHRTGDLGCRSGGQQLPRNVADWPDDLARIVNIWDRVPPAIKVAIRALLDASVSP